MDATYDIVDGDSTAGTITGKKAGTKSAKINLKVSGDTHLYQSSENMVEVYSCKDIIQFADLYNSSVK